MSNEKTSLSTSQQETPNGTKLSFEELILGVWRVLIVKSDSRFSTFNLQWENFVSTFPLLRRAVCDAYTISPRFFALLIFAELWSAIQSPLSLYLSNNLFFSIEKRVLNGFDDDKASSALYMAAIYRVTFSVFDAYMEWASRQNKDAYSSCIKYEFEARVFSANIARDLPASQDFASDVDSDSVYCCLEQGIAIIKDAISFVLHFQLMMYVFGRGIKDGGPLFVALCMLPSLVGHFQSTNLWSRAYVVDVANKFYVRKSALARFARPSLKQEVMAGGMNKFLMKEYRKTKDSLGDTSDSMPEILYSRQGNTFSNLLMPLCLDVPTLYFASVALISPSKLSIARLAALHQTSSSLQRTFSNMGFSMDYWTGVFSRMGNMYAALDVENKMKDGETPFPRPGYESSAGMGIEVTDVSFAYPNSKSGRNALFGVSFSILPGQLVVIVGANGSGKSTIIKLLSRFYDRTSGMIRIDGIPIEEYRMDELRRGIAMLTQEHRLFPLSLEENVRLGSVGVGAEAETGVEWTEDDREKVKESVMAAGAERVVNNFLSGYDTVLEPVRNGYVSYTGRGNKELEAMHEKLENSTSISGGEKQKLVAARTFMRLFTSSALKLVTVDEPSSALDPEAEYRLFANLRQERKGRTMIFVTHRFGHLTKHADLVICMKEGAVVELGTHADLLAKDGEYARLYNVQAQAFMAM